MISNITQRYFTTLCLENKDVLIPEYLNNPFETNIPEIAKIAAIDLQQYILKNQESWSHNFGFKENLNGYIKGKMFGILVVQNKSKQIGYLSAFSGKLDGDNFKNRFVPSLFDISAEDYFLDKGMSELTTISNKILALKSISDSQTKIKHLKEVRKNKSTALQQKIFDQYFFANKEGELKGLCSIFDEYSIRKPAAGAGECAAPKLLHFAFTHELKPIAIAEFWWGTTTKNNRNHLEFYAACEDKCRPILGFMLKDF